METRLGIREGLFDLLHVGQRWRRGATTAAGSTTTLVDTSLGSGKLHRDGEALIDSWLRISSGSAAEGISRVTEDDRSGTLTFAPALTAPPGSTETYELWHPDFHPALADDSINRVLQHLYVPHIWAPSLVPDADFGAEDLATYWPDVETPVTKEFTTDAANVLFGERAIYLTGILGAGVESTSFQLYPREQVLVCAFARGGIDNKFSVQLTNTGDTVWESATVENSSFVRAEFTYTTTWDLLQFKGRVRFVLDVASAFYVSPPVIVQSSIRRTYDAPSWLTSESQIVNGFYLPRGVAVDAGSYAENVYAALSHAPSAVSDIEVLHSARDVTPMRLEIEPSIGSGPLFLECLRPYTELSTDTATTNADKNVVVDFAADLMLDPLAGRKRLAAAKVAALTRTKPAPPIGTVGVRIG